MRRSKGKGTVVKIKDRYYARWTVDGHRVYGNPHDTHEQADKERLNKQPAEQPKAKSEIPAFQEWCQTCLEGGYGKKIASSTFETNETIRRVHIYDSALGKTKLHRLTKPLCQRWADDLKVTSASYKRRCVAFASKIASLAVDEGFITQNPFNKLDLPYVEERENRTLSPQEATKLLNPETRTDAIMLVAMLTGMRRGEVLRLEWSDIREETIKVPGTKTEKAKGFVPMTPEVKSAIEAQPKRSSFVFTTESGNPLSPRNVTRDVKVRKAQLGLPAETRLQDLRGSYVSLLIEQGVDPRAVMELARHSDVRTTMKAYARSRDAVKIEAVKKLASSIRLERKG